MAKYRTEELESISKLIDSTITSLNEKIELAQEYQVQSELTNLKVDAMVEFKVLRESQSLIASKSSGDINIKINSLSGSKPKVKSSDILKELKYEVLLSKQLANLDLRLSSKLELLRNEIYFDVKNKDAFSKKDKSDEGKSQLISREIQLTRYLKQLIIENHIIDVRMELKLINILLNRMMENQGFMKTSDLMELVNFGNFKDNQCGSNDETAKDIVLESPSNNTIHPFLLKLLKFGVVKERENFKYVKLRNFGIE